MRQIITFFEKKKIWLARITVFGIIVICQLFSLYQYYKTFTSHDKKNNQSPHWPTSLHTGRPISFVYTWKTQLTEFHYNFNTYKNSNMICMPISFLQIFLTRKFLPSLTQDCYNTEWVFLSPSLLFLGPTWALPISKAELWQTTNQLTTIHSWTAFLNIFSCLFLHTLSNHKLI